MCFFIITSDFLLSYYWIIYVLLLYYWIIYDLFYYIAELFMIYFIILLNYYTPDIQSCTGVDDWMWGNAECELRIVINSSGSIIKFEVERFKVD